MEISGGATNNVITSHVLIWPMNPIFSPKPSIDILSHVTTFLRSVPSDFFFEEEEETLQNEYPASDSIEQMPPNEIENDGHFYLRRIKILRNIYLYIDVFLFP